MTTVMPGIITGTGSLLHEDIHNSEYYPTTFETYRSDCNTHIGVAFVSISRDYISHEAKHSNCERESVWAIIQLVSHRKLYYWSYKTEYTDEEYFDGIRYAATTITSQTNGNIWLGGDFNLSGIAWQTESVKTRSTLWHHKL